jgi:hypothetical protein
MGSGFDDLLDASVTITVDYNSLHIELLLNDVCLTNLYEESLALSNSSQKQSHIATDRQSVSLGVEPHLRLMTRYLLLFDSYGLVFAGRLL